MGDRMGICHDSMSGDMGNGHVAAMLAESHQLSHPTPSHIPNSSTSPFARTFERRMGTSGLSGSGNGCLSVRGQLAWESRLSAAVVFGYVQDLRIIPMVQEIQKGWQTVADMVKV